MHSHITYHARFHHGVIFNSMAYRFMIDLFFYIAKFTNKNLHPDDMCATYFKLMIENKQSLTVSTLHILTVWLLCIYSPNVNWPMWCSHGCVIDPVNIVMSGARLVVTQAINKRMKVSRLHQPAGVYLQATYLLIPSSFPAHTQLIYNSSTYYGS